MLELHRPDKCIIVAEVAQAHDGSLGMAHSFIDAVAKAGADVVKFQTHIAEAETTLEEPWRIKFSYQDATRYDYWKRMEFSESQWLGLKEHADKCSLGFISSPFSIEAVDLLTRIGIPAWKIASGEVSNFLMLDRILETKLPIWLSSGMSDLAELDRTIEYVKSYGVPYTVLQCTTEYPCPPERVGLNMLKTLRERYQSPVGLSDHSGTIFPGLAAATLGANILEVHVTFSREVFGPDVLASITIGELKQLVDGIRFIERMRNNPVDKDRMAASLVPLRNIFTKSLVTVIDLPANTILERQHLTVKKPGTGIAASRLEEIIGAKIKRAYKANSFLQEEDIEFYSHA